jgi:hypothetical protein
VSDPITPAPLCRHRREELRDTVRDIAAHQPEIADVLATLLQESERADRAEKLAEWAAFEARSLRGIVEGFAEHLEAQREELGRLRLRVERAEQPLPLVATYFG